MKNSIIVLSVLVVWIVSCKKHETDSTQPAAPQATPISICDTSQVSYTKDVKPILVHYCYSCHSGSAAINNNDFADFSYLQLLVSDTNNYIPTVISQRTMPPKTSGFGYPDSCSINKIWAWVRKGAPQN